MWRPKLLMWNNIGKPPDNTNVEFLKISSWKCTMINSPPSGWILIDAASDTINALSNQIQ